MNSLINSLFIETNCSIKAAMNQWNGNRELGAPGKWKIRDTIKRANKQD